MKNKMRLGIQIILASLIFGFISTAYFGFNMTPSCHAELICDKITGVGSILGIIVFCYGLQDFFKD